MTGVAALQNTPKHELPHEHTKYHSGLAAV